MRKQPTEEQKQKTKERREKFRGFVKQLAKMSDSERAALAAKIPVIATCEGRVLSLHNQLLLACQCPTATMVGGFAQWRKLGRTVRKGEHGHMIWCPTNLTLVGDDTPQPSDLDSGEEKSTIRFIIGTVFDVAQTEELGGEVLA